MSDQKVQNFAVKGEPPLQAVPALYSNFVGLSRVGTEVQFEFVYLDLNYMASLLEQLKAKDNPGTTEVEGKTVAKVVMPAAVFLQLHEQFERVFTALKADLPAAESEVSNEQRTKSIVG